MSRKGAILRVTDFRSLVHRALKTRPGEHALLAWAAAYFYFLMASYYVMRPLRDELGTAGGVDDLKWLFSCSLLAMLILNPVYSWLVAKFRREVFIPLVYVFFAINIFIFFVLFRTASDQGLLYLGRTFYVWCAVFILFVVSVFWSLMVDLLTSDQAKRLFGSIAVGGTLGAISGSAITRSYIKSVGMQNFFLLAVVLLLLSVVCMLALTWIVNKRQMGEESSPCRTPVTKAIGGSVWSGIGQVFRSRYLLGICGFVLIYTITNTYVYLAKIQLGREMIERSTDRIAFFANIDLFANVLTVLVQVFLTSRLLTRLGIGITLTILPGISVIGFVVLAWSFRDIDPALTTTAGSAALVITGFESIRRACNYALARPAREALFTVLGREETYKSKSFIDTFIYRGGDQVGVWSHGLMSEVMLLSMATIALIAVPLAGIWLVLGLRLGRTQHQLDRQMKTASAPGITPVSTIAD